MSIPERREAVAELTEEGMSTREIGEVLGVGKSTVDRDISAVPDGTAEMDNTPGNKDAETSNVPNGTPEPEFPPVRDIPSVDELIADGDITLRRSCARLMLSKAAAATNQLSPSIE